MNRLPKSGRSIQKRTIGINHGSIKHPPAYLIREIGTQTTPGVRKEFRFQAIQVQFGVDSVRFSACILHSMPSQILGVTSRIHVFISGPLCL